MNERIKHIVGMAGLLAMLASLLGFTMALAASGGLDTTFSGDGKQTTDFALNWSDRPYGVVLQPDGKIVAAGSTCNAIYDNCNFALARYKSNGSLDTTFSGDGKQTTDFGEMDIAEDVALQSDGKIVVSGQTCTLSNVCDTAIARYTAGGNLDTTFNGTGKKTIGFGNSDDGTTLGGLAIQSDGKIVVAGYMKNGSGDYDMAVFRLNPNGSLDQTFSGDGRMHISFGVSRNDFAYDLVLQGSKIVVAGSTCTSSDTLCNFALARLNSNGSLDTTFSGDGRQVTDFGATERASAVALQPDGKLVATGEKNAATGRYFALARYNTNGSLDATLSGDGRQLISFYAVKGAWPTDVLVQSDGRIVVVGEAFNGTIQTMAVARLNTNGSLDSSFSGDGKTTIAFGSHNAFASSVLRQGDGKYVVGGTVENTASDDFALVRVLP